MTERFGQVVGGEIWKNIRKYARQINQTDCTWPCSSVKLPLCSSKSIHYLINHSKVEAITMC